MILNNKKCIFFIIFFINTINCQIIDWWNTYSDKNVKITFPCSPSKEEEDYGKNLSLKTISCKEDNLYYMLSVTTVPNPYGKSVRSILQSAINSGSISGASKISQKDIILNGHSGFEYVSKARIENDDYNILNRIYYLNGKVYSAKILYKINNYDKKSINEFLSSFKIK